MTAKRQRTSAFSISPRTRPPIEWRGTMAYDAFRPDLDYSERRTALVAFYEANDRAQRAAAAAAGGNCQSIDALRKRVPPQIAPCQTGYPCSFATQAAHGLTAFLTLQAELEETTVARLDAGATAILEQTPKLNQETLHFAMALVSQWVQRRLLLEDLARVDELGCIEFYRLFFASMNLLKFATLDEILQVHTIASDLVPSWEHIGLHEMTEAILRDLDKCSAPFFDQLASCHRGALRGIGQAWAAAILNCLAPYLPVNVDKSEPLPPDARGSTAPDQYRFSNQATPDGPPAEFQPLNDPAPPTLGPSHTRNANRPRLNPGEPRRLPRRRSGAHGSSSHEQHDASPPHPLSTITHVLAAATQQASGMDDIRMDLIEETLRRAPFARGAVEGSPVEGHEVNFAAGGEHYEGTLCDTVILPAHDEAAYDKLCAESSELARRLKRLAYPSLCLQSVPERFRTSGALDGQRLSLSSVSEAIFKRYVVDQRPDKRGRSVVLLILDGSGSLGAPQMRMSKVLTHAWIQATEKSGVEVLAGLYRTGRARENQLAGPLVEWMFGPRTPARSRREAARALIAVRDKGQGGQADALSIAFMLDEAKKVARGGNIYLVLITDCNWCPSFPAKGKLPQEEMRDLFHSAKEDLGERLHTTLVALGPPAETGVENVLDKTITVAVDRLGDYDYLATEVSDYVAAVMRRRAVLRKHF